MKKQKLIITLAVFGMLLGGSLVGCQKKDSNGSSSNPPSSKQPSSSLLPRLTVAAQDNKTQLVLGETVQLSANLDNVAVTGVSWTSSNEAVATVSASGLVSSVGLGTTSIKAVKDGFRDGTIAITVVRPAPTATLHFEDADHYSADGRWEASGRGPGATPIYEKATASDGTCVAYFGAGDSETLKFSSSAAVKAELVVTMGNNSDFSDLSTVEVVKFNDETISMEGVAFVSGSDGSGNYPFIDVSLGEVDLVNGENTLRFEFLASAPYLDDLKIYAKGATTITLIPAPVRESVQVQETTLSVEQGKTVQINCDTAGVTYTSSNEEVATVDENGLVTGVAKGTTTIVVAKEEMLPVSVTINVTDPIVAGEIKVEAESGSGEGITFRTPSTSGASGQIVDAFPQGATLTITFEADSAALMAMEMISRGNRGTSFTDVNLETDVEIKVNDVKVNATGVVSGQYFNTYPLGDVSVKAGVNTITVEALVLGPGIDFFRFLPK